MDIVAPSTACATGATAKIAGAAGLVISAGLDFGVDLTAAQVRSILRSTADDVYLSDADQSIVNTYPSTFGWDAFYGYGRVNVGTAVDRIRSMEPGPSVSITGPKWFSFMESLLEVSGDIDATSWTASWGLGLEPEDWTEFASGDGPANGVLGQLELSGVSPIMPSQLSPKVWWTARFVRMSHWLQCALKPQKMVISPRIEWGYGVSMIRICWTAGPKI